MLVKSSRSNELSSRVRIPPTLAYTAFVVKMSQKASLAMTMDVKMKRWHVREESVKRGKRMHI